MEGTMTIYIHIHIVIKMTLVIAVRSDYHVFKQFWKWFDVEAFGNKIEAKKVPVDA